MRTHSDRKTLTRREALTLITDVWNLVEYEWGPGDLDYTELADVLAAIDCTPEEIALGTKR